jgi:uncharacterized protein YhaN
MRITALKVDGFGVWSDLDLDDLSDQLNVFYGPNEAGKTTLMQFVRSVLYGFSPERRGRYLPPLRAGRPGGTIHAVAGEAAYAVSRHADAAGEMGDAAVISQGQQIVPDERLLGELLGEVDEPTFNNVFAFGLSEIQELGMLSDTQAAKELYSLALGLDRVSLVDVLGELDASRNRLLASDDRPSLVTQLLSQHQRLQNEIEDLGHSTTRYLALSAEREKLDEETSRLEAESGAFERQGRELALARALSERWQRRQAIDRELQAIGSFETLPEDALARFDRLASRLATRRRRFERLKGQRRELRSQIEQLPINEPLCRNAMRLEAVDEQRQWIESLERLVGELEGEILELESHRDASQGQLGIGPRTPGTRTEPLSQRGLAELRAAAKSLRDARRNVRPLRQQIATAQEKAASLKRQTEGALGKAREKGLTQAVAEAGERVSQLRTRVQLDERLDQMSRREAELKEQGHEQVDNQMLSGWVLAGLGCFFALGCALILLYLAGMVLPASLSASLGWPVALVGLVTAGSTAATKLALERRVSGQLDTSRQQSQVLAQQIKQAKAQRDELDERLPRGGGPLVARLQAAEKELAALEEFLPLEAQRDATQREADATARQEETLLAVYQQRRKEWRRLLVAGGLPAELPPRRLLEYARRSEQMRGLNNSIDQKNEELKRRRGEYEALTARITQLVAEVGVTPRAKRPLDQLQQCLAELNEQQIRLKRREELTRQIAKVRRRQVKLSHAADKLRRRRQLLLHSAGTTDEAEFRRRARAQAEGQRLRVERGQLAHEISLAIAGQCGEEQLAQRLSGIENLEQLDLELGVSRQTATRQLNELLVRRGEMNQQLKMLAEDRQLPYKRIELGIVEKRLQDTLDRWRVLTVCGMMLEAVRQYYEREHQPQALREASVYLQRLTSGRYTRVWTPLGEHSLRVDDGQGNTLNVEVLSRGTREQLFLALRLALVSSYARRGVNLPLVLDDVLVNFDVGRAKAAAAVLRDFAKLGHQILIFTCHEHISKLFKHIKAEVRQLPDNTQPQTLLTEQQPAKKSRRSRAEPDSQPDFTPELDELEVELAVAEDVKTHEEPEPPAAKAEPAPQPAPPPPLQSRPPLVRPMQARPQQRTQRIDWSAEEFAGELADRVRGTETPDETPGQADSDDSEAA